MQTRRQKSALQSIFSSQGIQNSQNNQPIKHIPYIKIVIKFGRANFGHLFLYQYKMYNNFEYNLMIHRCDIQQRYIWHQYMHDIDTYFYIVFPSDFLILYMYVQTIIKKIYFLHFFNIKCIWSFFSLFFVILFQQLMIDNIYISIRS